MHKLVDIRKTIPRHKTKKWKTRMSADTIVVHTTASDNQDPNSTAAYHISSPNHISKTGCPSICYHDYITKDGIIYHCNSYQYILWHARLYNKRSVGVVLAFKGQEGEAPEHAQYFSLIEHLVVLCLYLKILPKRIIGHREVPSMYNILGNGSIKYKKLCPGIGIDLDSLRNSVTCRLQRRLAAENLYHGKIDGIFGKASSYALSTWRPPNTKTKKIYWRAYNEL